MKPNLAVALEFELEHIGIKEKIMKRKRECKNQLNLQQIMTHGYRDAPEEVNQCDATASEKIEGESTIQSM